MSPSRLASASLLILAFALPAAALAAAGGPAGPSSPGLAGPPGPRAVKPGSTLPASGMRTLPKPTAAERAEKRKLDHDLRICIGC